MIKAGFKPFAVAGILGCAIFSFSTIEAHAVSYAQIDTIEASWTVVDPGNGISVHNGNSSLPVIAWGSGFKSAYVFKTSNTSPTPLTFYAGGTGILGTFKHWNWPITGTSLKEAELNLTFSGSVVDDGTQVGTFNATSNYTFTHEETPNSGDCDYPSIRKCADKVTVSNGGFGKTFTMDGKEYVLSVDGFTNGSALTSEFITQEKQWNKAKLQASLLESNAVPVPEIDATAGMGSLAALGAMLAFMRGRRRQNAA